MIFFQNDLSMQRPILILSVSKRPFFEMTWSLKIPIFEIIDLEIINLFVELYTSQVITSIQVIKLGFRISSKLIEIREDEPFVAELIDDDQAWKYEQVIDLFGPDVDISKFPIVPDRPEVKKIKILMKSQNFKNLY